MFDTMVQLQWLDRASGGRRRVELIVFTTYCWQIEYDDGDQEIGATFQRYSVEQGPAAQQVVKVHEFKPGNYKPQAEHVEGSKAATTSTAKQSAEDMSVTGEA